MITKEEVLKIAIELLKKSNIDYSNIDTIDKIFFISKDEMKYSLPHGKYKGKKIDHFTITYGEVWGIEERSMGIKIKADTGEPLYIITPHGYIDID